MFDLYAYTRTQLMIQCYYFLIDSVLSFSFNEIVLQRFSRCIVKRVWFFIEPFQYKEHDFFPAYEVVGDSQ